VIEQTILREHRRGRSRPSVAEGKQIFHAAKQLRESGLSWAGSQTKHKETPMKLIFTTGAALLCALALQGQALAADKGSAAEAVALVQKAGAYLKANGKDKAYAEFNNPAGAFKDRDLYIMVYDLKGTAVAHGANAKLIGKDLIDLKDAEGTPIVRSFIDTANGKGKGWVDYKWPNPVSKAIEAKSTYVEKHGDVLIGAGIYK
jgi:cytochrome c